MCMGLRRCIYIFGVRPEKPQRPERLSLDMLLTVMKSI